MGERQQKCLYLSSSSFISVPDLTELPDARQKDRVGMKTKRTCPNAYNPSLNVLFLSIYLLAGASCPSLSTFTLLLLALTSATMLPPTQELNPYQAQHKVDHLPNLIEYLGYAFCCGNLLAGPFVEYHEYMDCVEEKGVRAGAALT
eukprot:1161652-Pelagomonas_calceolata.AAC.2